MRRVFKISIKIMLALTLLIFALVLVFAVFHPRRTPYMMSESNRLGGIEAEWVGLDEMAPIVPLAAVAGEDANFCEHWGLDLDAILAAARAGGARGGSTISQQTVKNVYLWQGRSYTRKAIEALMTPAVELVWTKRRILETYLNVAEFDTGVFGIEAAAWHHYGVSSRDLSNRQAALLIAVLPNPKGLSAVNPTQRTSRRANQIIDGARTIRRDGRAACFQ